MAIIDKNYERDVENLKAHVDGIFQNLLDGLYYEHEAVNMLQIAVNDLEATSENYLTEKVSIAKRRLKAHERALIAFQEVV